MKRVSVYVDFDSTCEVLESGLTPSLFAQRLTAAASVLGQLGGTHCHAEWFRHPASIRDAFEGEGWECGEPLTSPAAWRAVKEELARDRTMVNDLAVVVVSSNKGLATRADELREYASEIVFWHGGSVLRGASGWDRVDSLPRILDIADAGVTVVVDVQGLVASGWSAQDMTDVDSLLAAIERAVSRLGRASSRVAFADWHTLPVMRNREGDPITHEAEGIFRRAGYGTPLVPPLSLGQPLPDEVVVALEHLEYAQDVVLVGRSQVVVAQARLLEGRAARIHLWSDERPDTPAWIAWRPLVEVLENPPSAVTAIHGDGGRLLPSLWSRIGLLTDRAIADAGAEAIADGDLVAILINGAPFIRRSDQALALISQGVSRGTLVEIAKPDGRGSQFRINDDDRGIIFMRDLLKALMEILGEGPGEGTGVPVCAVIDALMDRPTLSSERSQNRRSLLAWLNFLVDEGILVRFGVPAPEGAGTVPGLAFSPLPLKGVQVPAPAAPLARGPVRSPRQAPAHVPPRLREHLIMVVDIYAVRHGRPAAPIAAVRKALAEYGGHQVEAAVREGGRIGDLQTTKGAPGSLALNQQSKFVRLVVGRKNTAISMLKQMAPMGQPIGEARIKSAFTDALNIRDDEVGDLLNLLLKERILRREPQIMTSGGPSYTLSLEDAAVLRAHAHAMSREAGRRRFGGESARGHTRGHLPREKRRP